VLNQNYEPRWMTSTGAPVDDLGRLAVDLPAGRRRVKLWFAPDDLPWSVLASAAGVIACAAILARPWRRRRRVAAPRAHG